MRGQEAIEKTEEHMYLGFVLSSIGNNMANINSMKKKSKGIIRKIFNRINSLNLRKYYFQSAIVLMNAMLRSSILYACETYYNLKEGEIRQIERIEEGFLRELLKTSPGCPIKQIYLEFGQIPARFEIIRIRLLYLKYILNQNKESMIHKFFTIQLESSGKGDWTTMCLDNLRELDVQNSLEEIKQMSPYQFKKMLKEKVRQAALQYLTDKRGSKGAEINYQELQMADYLQPIADLSIDVKRKIFEVRNKMTRIPANFSSRKTIFKCVCGEQEDMSHVYSCTVLNSDKPVTQYEEIYSNNIEKIKEVYQRFENNINEREQIMNKNENEDKNEKVNKRKSPHAILISDPLYTG